MPDAIQELTDLSHTLLLAIRHRDRATLESVLHAGFVRINEAGVRTERHAFLDVVVSADFQISDLRFEFLSVDVAGDAGVVCGVQRAAVRLASGEDVIGRTAFTDVFVRSGGDWLLRVATSAELP